MLDSMKNLAVRTVYLGLILSAHLGTLLLAYEDLLASIAKDRTLLPSILFSLLVLLFSLPFALLVFHKLNVKKDLLLYSIVTALFIFLAYSALFLGEAYKIAASTGLFLAVVALIAFCDSKRAQAAWRNLQRGLAIALFLTLPLCWYVKPQIISDLALHFEDTRITPTESRFKKKSRRISTAFYDVDLTRYYPHAPMRIGHLEKESPAHISALDDKNFLLITRFGNIYHLTLKQRAGAPDEELYLKKLSAVFPINHHELDSSRQNENILRHWFTVNDLYTDVENEVRVLYVSHHFWNVEKECFTLRISKLVGDVSILLKDTPPQWKTLYETVPCFSLRDISIFKGNQAGGRIIGLDENSLLFSAGDHGFDTRTPAPGPDDDTHLPSSTGGHGSDARASKNFPQDRSVSYGKILKINRRSGQAELFSLGHRNPQGLYRAPNGSTWETEHGPHGGDELNKIEESKNYGWPHVVYGTGHPSKKIWPPSPHQNRHDGYEQPAFAWTPSIGVSNLIGVEQDLFPTWKGNLLVGSLKARTLFRLQLHEDRVIYSEPIGIGHRIGDLTETPNGEIFILTRDQHLIRLRPADALPNKDETIAEAGERLFFKCAGCHSLNPNAPHGIGPNLHDIYNGRIATRAGYSYSPGLQARSSQKWTRENLSLFLKDPEAFAPGTPMQIKIPDDDERKALLHYLKNH